MKHKSEVYHLFVTFKSLVKHLFNHKIKMFQSDGGKEFDKKSMHQLFLIHGIYFRKSCPDAQQQIGVVERKHRHLLEMTRSFLIDASLLASFWLDALYAEVFTIGRFSTPLLHEKSPYETLFVKVLDYKFLRSFGCACFPHLIATSTNKLFP